MKNCWQMNVATVLKLTPNILCGVYCHSVYVELTTARGDHIAI